MPGFGAPCRRVSAMVRFEFKFGIDDVYMIAAGGHGCSRFCLYIHVGNKP